MNEMDTNAVNLRAMPRPMRILDKYTNTQLHNAAHAMHKTGGGFASRLAEAYFYADLHNRRKLLDAFGDLFERFVKEEVTNTEP